MIIYLFVVVVPVCSEGGYTAIRRRPGIYMGPPAVSANNFTHTLSVQKLCHYKLLLKRNPHNATH